MAPPELGKNKHKTHNYITVQSNELYLRRTSPQL